MRVFGLLAALALLLGLSPGIAAASPARQGDPVNAAAFTIWRNAGLPDMCMANHNPKVFMHYGPSTGSGFCGQYDDQFWSIGSSGMIQNLFSGNCLATHGAEVFTSTCDSTYRDQRWIGYPPDPALLENRQYPGMCLAAHANGYVFVSACNPNYADQHWNR
ncbi:ricin-type beta-trefoil lectin domain protein [Lentzea sp. CC55]|uniref:ricin-type beta-trefoil lectin domain protein n=1 Tax=Lentzea sp. CC55 TaxID=2884909 RepID=UPI001F295E7D|nr:ricin-type beta-trefoil lectin domain protein [Lentzea sp. CC55]MCG8927009.1 RICIN domain-containing protein [Lentzea sp. CC55]